MKKMADFDKESFKKDVINNVKNLFRKTIDEATQEQVIPGSVLRSEGSYH